MTNRNIKKKVSEPDKKENKKIFILTPVFVEVEKENFSTFFDVDVIDKKAKTRKPAENITKEKYLEVAKKGLKFFFKSEKDEESKKFCEELLKDDNLLLSKWYRTSRFKKEFDELWYRTSYKIEKEEKRKPLNEESQRAIYKQKAYLVDRQMTLFNNPIDIKRAFGISREFTDNLKRLTDEITPETATENFKYNSKTFKGKRGDLALRVIDDKQEIQTAEQFYNALARIKSGKVLQTLLSLWYYGNKQGGFVFSGTRLSKVMRTILKTKGGYFTQPQKRDFTEAIQRLRDFEIYLDQTITDTDEKGRKQKVIKRDFYKLIDLVGATYAKRKQDLIDPETSKVIFKKGDVDESVIIKLYGELLPRFNKGIMRGRLYSRGLLELDANKDERAILLGFKLLTRFDQLRQGAKGKDLVSDNNLFIKTDRKTLIEWTDYTKTDLEDKWTANNYLTKTLKKLIEINCLRDYEPEKLTTDDDLKITLYPSAIALKPPAKDDQTLKIEAPKPEGTGQTGLDRTG